MKPPIDPEAHRNTLLREQDDVIAQHLAASLRSGELQSAESFGKPLQEAEGWFETPLEFRLPFKILKNANLPPPEVELFHRRASLREAYEQCTDAVEKLALQRQLAELEQALALRLEGLRASGSL
jgi:hypothetical protein